MVKRTFGALAGGPTFNLSAARSTFIAVRFAVRATHRFILLGANTRTYANNQINGYNAALVSRRVAHILKKICGIGFLLIGHNICGGTNL